MFSRNCRAHFPPSVAEGIFARRFARNRQCLHAGRPQVFVQDARPRTDDVDRAGDRKGRDRQSARQRFDHHDAERIGAGGKDEDVGAGVDLRERSPCAPRKWACG